jgi:hypothetical protein
MTATINFAVTSSNTTAEGEKNYKEFLSAALQSGG